MQGSTHAGLSATMPHIQCQLALFTHKHAMGRCRRQLNGLGPQALGASGAPWGLQSRGAWGCTGATSGALGSLRSLAYPGVPCGCLGPLGPVGPLRSPKISWGSQSSRVSWDPIGPLKVSWGSLGVVWFPWKPWDSKYPLRSFWVLWDRLA